jgi:uncharacterized protein (DUF1501 family)
MKRRNFLKILPSAATVTPFVVNGHTMRPFANTSMARLIGNCEEVEGRTIVLIQLKGGNDGLNTIIPIAQYDKYVELRPDIAIPETGADAYIPLDSTLKGDKQIGLHPHLTGIKELYDKGWVNIVQGVGCRAAMAHPLILVSQVVGWVALCKLYFPMYMVALRLPCSILWVSKSAILPLLWAFIPKPSTKMSSI